MDLDFSSRSQKLYDRSLVASKGSIVLIGWFVIRNEETDVPSPVLAEFRRSCERYGVAHRYHATPKDQDADICIWLLGISL